MNNKELLEGRDREWIRFLEKWHREAYYSLTDIEQEDVPEGVRESMLT